MITAFDNLVAERMSLTSVPIDGDEILRLQVGLATAQIRRSGAMILDASLVDHNGLLVPVLATTATTSEELRAPKLSASHFMSPAGPYEGPGKQHGPARWLHYVEDGSTTSETSDLLVLTPESTKDAPVAFSRMVRLKADELRITSWLTNMTDEPLSTSVGEHLYFANPAPDDAQLELNHEFVDDVLGEPGAQEAIMSGSARLWHMPRGRQQLITFADGRIIRMRSSYMIDDDNPRQVREALLWKRPGTGTTCIEPTIGVSAGDSPSEAIGNNTGLILKPHGRIALSTVLSLAA